MITIKFNIYEKFNSFRSVNEIIYIYLEKMQVWPLGPDYVVSITLNLLDEYVWGEN